jgi:osmoprotectant transport system ATP-binding protein
MIEFKNIKKAYADTQILKGIDLKIAKGEFVVLVGPSGCGKTTTLKMINKLITATSGHILIDGKNVADLNTIELRRSIGYVIQQTGLFPHLTVKENIEIVPKLLKWPNNKIKERTLELLKLVGMDPENYLDRYPNELSGGQQQRIGVARAFATNPEIILMDEPFSALDPITRNQLQDELFNLQQDFKKTIVFVTHDMSEALKLGDKICIMKDGEILQFDTPENLLTNPKHGFVEDFIGRNRIWDKPEFIKARDIMIKDPVKSIAKRNLIQGMEIMKMNKVDSILIVDAYSKLQGILTLKTIRQAQDKTATLGTIMDKEFLTVNERDSIIDVLKKMKLNNTSYTPVVTDTNTLIGLITRSSLLEVLTSHYIDEEVII